MSSGELLCAEGTGALTGDDRNTRAERLIASGDLFSLGELYINGRWEPADLHRQLSAAVRNARSKKMLLKPALLRFMLRDLLLNTQRGEGAFEVGRRHYDLGNDLFEVMLDESRSYTSGYWAHASTLHDAQRAKLDLICRKLKLEPGMRVLDIGCGWGNFAEHAARNYGVCVTGLTISKEQEAFARRRCSGLDVTIKLESYEAMSGTFDRVVSIEMIEAVGRRNLGRYFQKIEHVLSDDGLFLLQAISAQTFTKRSHPALDSFIVYLLKYIFPNGFIPPLDALAEPGQARLRLEDLHNFSADYARTLAAWRERFTAGWEELSARYSEEFRRMWIYYLEGCRVLFESRITQVYQIVYAKEASRSAYVSIR